METPIAFATGAAYFMVAPNPSNVVLLCVNVFVRTSLTRFMSLALKPKPVKIFDAMSDAEARSIAPALARFSIPGMVSTISFVLNPAMAKYCIPWAASLALHWVSAPSCRAVAVSCCNCSSLARETAATFAMSLSNAAPIVIDFASPAPMAMPTPLA